MVQNSKKRDAEPNDSTASATRVWQACTSCRRKKIKCDGQQPCHHCSSRDAACEYPGSNDNASTSRQYATSFEARFQQLDTFCQRLENLASQLSQTVETLTSNKLGALQHGVEDELLQAANALQSLPEARQILHASPDDLLRGRAHQEQPVPNNQAHEPQEDSDSDGLDDDLNFTESQANEVERFGSLVTDSYGKLRFVGGATNSVLIEAVQSLSPGQSTASESPGMLSVSRDTGNQEGGGPRLEIPLFVHGQRWPELPHLPKVEQLSRPPQYISDLLVNLYFDQLHYTFPVVYKPQFMARYKHMNLTRLSEPPDGKFLSVFFAVCACASSLLPSDGKSQRFAGIDYYEKALLLHYSSHAEASVERVQCLALLAMCTAGWNTLTTSWSLAGQAVRAAQDLGMHLSGLTSTADLDPELDSSIKIRQQMSRRIWWSIYCLDRVTSICLGRPMAAHDADCHCDLPLDIDDDHLEEKAEVPLSGSQPRSGTTPMTGFLAFARLCRIGGKIQELYSPSRIRETAVRGKTRRFLRSVAALDKALNEWLVGLPDAIRFSANALDRGPNLTMCVIMFIVHAGSLLNLYRSLMGSVGSALASINAIDPISHCISAARSCINAAELIRELVPPSHHLAFCVHYLTLSGLVLLRMNGQPRDQVLPDVEKCVGFLKDLEMTWSGAARSRAIIEQLLHNPGRSAEATAAALRYRPQTDFESTEVLSWVQLPGSELFTFGQSSADLLNAWVL
ncbi:fungal-specific transcription factor domain-containing protein [Xylariales sp. PMI_506]|nr:fungal-specific transcription factor domain-containing protein [Xylariales sp. PMI_506]